MKKATKHRLKAGSTILSSTSHKPTRAAGSKNCLESSVSIEKLVLDPADSSFHGQMLETSIKQNWVIRCPLCNKIFQSNRVLKVHMKHHTGNEPMKFNEAKHTSTPERKAALKNHRKRSRSQKRAYCPKCDKWFFNKGTLQVHTNLHTGIKPMKCSIKGCTATFSNHAAVKIHKSKVHGINNSLLSAVQSLSANNEKLVDNVNALEHEKDNFSMHAKKDTTTNCIEAFLRGDAEVSGIHHKHDMNDEHCLNSNKVILRSAVKKTSTSNSKEAVDTGKVVFKRCPKCDEALADNFKCSCCSTSQPYCCEEGGCEAEYTFRSSLLNHKRAVHGKDAVPRKASRDKKTPSSKRVCTSATTKRSRFCTKCKKTIFGNRKFEMHSCCLTKRQLYKCNANGCGAVYSYKVHLVRHEKLVHSGKGRSENVRSSKTSYVCTTCKNTIFGKQKFETHNCHPTEIQLYKCNEDGCSATYAYKSNLVRHQKKRHGENLNCKRETTTRALQAPKGTVSKCMPTPAAALENSSCHKKAVGAENCELTFKCRKEGCQAAYMCEKSLLRHMANVHGESVDESVLHVKSEALADADNERLENGKRDARVYEKGVVDHKVIHGEKFGFTLNLETEMQEKAAHTVKDTFANRTLDRNANSKKSYFCADCNKFFFRKPIFEKHVNFHAKMQMFKCRECSAVYTCEKWLMRHVRRIHDKTLDMSNDAKKTALQNDVHKDADVSVASKQAVDPRIEPQQANFCTICSRTFSCKERYERHANLHIKKALFRCNKTGCKASYAYKRWLVHHNKKVHGGKLDFSLSGENGVSQLAAHKPDDVNLATNGFCHDYPQKNVSTKRKFERHNNFHTKMQIYRCNEKGCLAVYTLEKWLMRHKEKVHGKKLETILTANSDTSQKDLHKNEAVSLSTKSALDNDNNPQTHKICSKGGKSNFEAYTTNHTNLSLYVCSEDECEAVYMHHRSLLRHKVKNHRKTGVSSTTTSPTKKIAPSHIKTLHVYDFDSFESPSKKDRFINCNLKGARSEKNKSAVNINKESAHKRKRLASSSRKGPGTKRKLRGESTKARGVGKSLGLIPKNAVHFATLKRLSSRKNYAQRKNAGLPSSLCKGTLMNQRIAVRKEKFGSFSFVKRGKLINHRKSDSSKSVGCSSDAKKRKIESRKKVVRSKTIGSNSSIAQQRDGNHKEAVCVEDNQSFTTKTIETANVRKEVVTDPKDACVSGTVTSVLSAIEGMAENKDQEIADSLAVTTLKSMTKNTMLSYNELFSKSASNVSQELQSHKEGLAVEKVKPFVKVVEDTVADHENLAETLLIESLVAVSDHNDAVISENISNEAPSTLLGAGHIINSNFPSDTPDEASEAIVCCENGESPSVENSITAARLVKDEILEKDESLLLAVVPNEEPVGRENDQLICVELGKEIANHKETDNENNNSSDVNKEMVAKQKKPVHNTKVDSLSNKRRWALRSTILKSRRSVRSDHVTVFSNDKKRTLRNKSSRHDKKAETPPDADKNMVVNLQTCVHNNNLESLYCGQKIKLRSQKPENAVEETNISKSWNNATSPSNSHVNIIVAGQNVESIKLMSNSNNIAQKFKCTKEGCIATYSHIVSLHRHQKAVHGRKLQRKSERDIPSANEETKSDAVDQLRILQTTVNVKKTFDDKKMVDSVNPEKVSTKERPYKCREEGCDARYSFKSSMYRHRRFAHANGNVKGLSKAGNPSAPKRTVKDSKKPLQVEKFKIPLNEVVEQGVNRKGQQEEHFGLNGQLVTRHRRTVRSEKTVFSSLNCKKVFCSANSKPSSSSSSSATIMKADKKSETGSGVKNELFLDNKKICLNETVASPSSLASSTPEFTSTPIPGKIKSYQNNHKLLAFSPSLHKSIRHTSIKPYKCQELDCGATFASVGSMWNHKIAFHDRTTPLKVIINSSA